ncbi:ferredoxin [Candidatus Woesearchaeota archaeon]|nr:ferredoxin [Candidatus Woesearchaeota archaeon]
MVKLVHYRVKCIGCNSCCEHAPEHWRINPEDGKAELIGSVEKNGVWIKEISDFDVAENEEAAKDCPVNIIKLQ